MVACSLDVNSQLPRDNRCHSSHLCIQATMAVARLVICTGSNEPLLPAYAMGWPNYFLVCFGFTSDVIPLEKKTFVIYSEYNKGLAHMLCASHAQFHNWVNLIWQIGDYASFSFMYTISDGHVIPCRLE